MNYELVLNISGLQFMIYVSNTIYLGILKTTGKLLFLSLYKAFHHDTVLNDLSNKDFFLNIYFNFSKSVNSVSFQ